MCPPEGLEDAPFNFPGIQMMANTNCRLEMLLILCVHSKVPFHQILLSILYSGLYQMDNLQSIHVPPLKKILLTWFQLE